MLKTVYTKLLHVFRPQCWWHADSLFEICIGIILVQHATWVNADKAIANLKKANMLKVNVIASAELPILECAIKSAGFYKQKANYLQIFARHVRDHYNGELNNWLQKSLFELRQELLGIKGIGPETADSILLYAANKPIFVIDAYTKRIFYRLGIISNENIGYQELQDLIHSKIKQNAHTYNEFHALLIKLGKEFCRKKPLCVKCPLKEECKYYKKRII